MIASHLNVQFQQTFFYFEEDIEIYKIEKIRENLIIRTNVMVLLKFISQIHSYSKNCFFTIVSHLNVQFQQTFF